MLERIRTYSRRTYLINKRLQTRFVVGFSSAVFLGFVFNMLVVYFLIDRELTGELYKIHLTIRTTSEIAVPVILKLGAVTIPSIVAVSAFIGYLITRRIELPLQTFREAVKRTSGRDFTTRLPVELPTAIPEGFNRMSDSLGASFSSLKSSFSELEDRFKGLELLLTGGPSARASAREALAGISGARKRMGQALCRFKV